MNGRDGAVTGGGVQAVVLAAGRGVRMCSELPKVLHRLCGRTLVERAVRSVLGLRPLRVVIVVGFGADLVRKEIEELAKGGSLGPTEIVCITQEEQLGTGHAMQIALPALRSDAEEVIILPGDVPLLDDALMLEFVEDFRRSAAALGVLTCTPPDAASFGRIVRDGQGVLRGIVEKKDCTSEQLALREINSGVYAARYAFLREALPTLKNNNAQREFYLTDIVAYGVQSTAKVAGYCSPQWERLLGANSRRELSELERMRRLELAGMWMDRGVTFEDPASVYLEEEVTLGRDVFLGAGVRLRGTTSVGDGTVIDGGTFITSAIVGPGVHIKPGCVIEDSRIGAACAIGPFAHLRPGSELCDTVRIGNFVETKKTTLGRGAKANHLTYLGDATIGAEANVGAGTITCNYDGVNKHQTVIGEGAFIGSNSCLVAPVTVGKEAYVGAGSTITKEVPPGSLGIGRSRQQNIAEWTTRKKPHGDE